ncbi:glycosyltransferase family 4 protein [Paenibacillus sp. GCM10012307]|uniref:Glycosyltransferase family 4 protein n=1 Tax=Paenibacillus roseus TaxID=2798579 RepID=A0A934J7Y1_9BACL|nr:glycosyltransferase family 4 protein [Paenibacillus roseus]MBJ6362062.1 glycosyltransferase family 4 protein [Paenibacillus roseus]
MKILLATYWPVPHLGGVWPYMEQLKMGLEALGHEVDLLGYGDVSGNLVYIVNQGRQIDTDPLLPVLKAKLRPDLYPVLYEHVLIEYTEFRRYAYELAVAYLGIESYDVIHTQDIFSTVAIDRIRHSHTALVASIHGCVAHEMRYHLATDEFNTPTSHIARTYFDWMEHNGGSAAEYTVLANNWMKNNLSQEFRVAPDSLKVFQYGYDIPKFLDGMKASSELRRPPGKKVIVYTGRLVELKGVHHLLAALAQLKAVRQDWVCWIVGDGDKATELTQQCLMNGLEDMVVFWGRRDDIPALLGQSDIYVLPSLIENQPMSIIEAQLAGLAIITTNAGGLPEMTEHRVTGLLTPVGDPNSLFQAFDELLKNNKLRRLLGARAHKWAMRHWSMSTMVQRMTSVYEQAIHKRKNRR